MVTDRAAKNGLYHGAATAIKQGARQIRTGNQVSEDGPKGLDIRQMGELTIILM